MEEELQFCPYCKPSGINILLLSPLCSNCGRLVESYKEPTKTVEKVEEKKEELPKPPIKYSKKAYRRA